MRGSGRPQAHQLEALLELPLAAAAAVRDDDQDRGRVDIHVDPDKRLGIHPVARAPRHARGGLGLVTEPPDERFEVEGQGVSTRGFLS
jgi:hypothetical protein